MTERRGTSPLVMTLTLAGAVVVFLIAGWAVVFAMSAFYAAPTAPSSGLAHGKASGAAFPSALASGAASSGAPVASGAATAPAAGAASSAGRTFVVVIDAGHQRHADLRQEPIGPGSKVTKPAVASGTEGVVTHNPENVINLAVSLKLRDILQRQPGVRVVMIRTTPDVDIPNSQRAKIAAREHADLLIRVHCDGVDDHRVHGLLTMVPAKDQWTGPILAASARAGRIIQDATLKTTGAKDRGILPVSNMSGFNWSTVPSVIVEMAVMTNPTDDRLLASQGYQDKLAQGMADGVVAYFHTLR